MCQPFGATRTTAANPQCIGNLSSTSPRNQLFAHVILTTRMKFSNGTLRDISFETLRRRRCLNIATAMASFRHQTAAVHSLCRCYTDSRRKRSRTAHADSQAISCSSESKTVKQPCVKNCLRLRPTVAPGIISRASSVELLP